MLITQKKLENGGVKVLNRIPRARKQGDSIGHAAFWDGTKTLDPQGDHFEVASEIYFWEMED